MFAKTTEYALRAAVYLSENPNHLQTAQQVADATHTPTRYASRVLQLLVEAGLAVSQRGPTGGFGLSRRAADITLLDVVSAVEPVDRIPACPLGLVEHADELCPLHRTMDRVAKATEEILGAATLASVMSQGLVPLGLSALDPQAAQQHAPQDVFPSGQTFPVVGDQRG